MTAISWVNVLSHLKIQCTHIDPKDYQQQWKGYTCDKQPGAGMCRTCDRGTRDGSPLMAPWTLQCLLVMSGLQAVALRTVSLFAHSVCPVSWRASSAMVPEADLGWQGAVVAGCQLQS